MKLLLIIPIHFENSEMEKKVSVRMHEHLRPVLDSSTELDIIALPAGATPSIECRLDRNINSMMVVQTAIEAEKAGYQGIFVSDMDMCGVDLCREVLSIPVIGGFRPSAHTAMLLASKFSIVTILDNVVSMQKDHIDHFALGGRFASIRVGNIPVCDLIDDPSLAIPALIDESLKAVYEDGAESIILGCTGFIGVAGEIQRGLLQKGCDIPVIDPNRTALNYLELLVKNSVSQSKKTYMFPRRDHVKFFQPEFIR